MKLNGHYYLTKEAIERVKRNKDAPLYAKEISTYDAAMCAVARDVKDGINLGHWLNAGQKHHFMRRFDGQSEYDAHKDAVDWIRANVIRAAGALHNSMIELKPSRGMVSNGIGNAAHAIQDSFAEGHCKREGLGKNNPGVITKVKMYAGEEKEGHSDHDTEWGETNVSGKAVFSKTGENAIRATAAMLLHVARRANWLRDRKNIDKPDFSLFQNYWLNQKLSKSRDFSYDFIKRFATFGQAGNRTFTMTLRMDEKGMAKALYKEIPNDGEKTYTVFSRLNEFHNSDVDDVAEIYVNLIRKQGGPAKQMLKKNPKIVKLLICALDEGWTSSGEKACIDYLNKL